VKALLLDSEAGPELDHPTEMLPGLRAKGLLHIKAAAEVPPDLERMAFDIAVVHVRNDQDGAVTKRLLAAGIPTAIISQDPRLAGAFAERHRGQDGRPTKVEYIPLREIWGRLEECFAAEDPERLFDDFTSSCLDLLTGLYAAQLKWERTGSKQLEDVHVAAGNAQCGIGDLALRVFRGLATRKATIATGDSAAILVGKFLDSPSAEAYCTLLRQLRDELVNVLASSEADEV
jgi:hypothetical protein